MKVYHFFVVVATSKKTERSEVRSEDLGLTYSDKETGFYRICGQQPSIFVKTRFLNPMLSLEFRLKNDRI
jgi:hypothetical protein